MPVSPPFPERPQILVIITRGEAGGAQNHVLALLQGLSARAQFQLCVGDDDGFLTEAARALGVPVHLVPALQREISPRVDRRAYHQLRAIIRQVRPQVVHTHSTKAGLLGRFAAHAEGVPTIHTAHAWSFSDGLAWQRKALAIPLEAAAGRCTTRFIVVSEADREIALRYRVAQGAQVRIVHNGVQDVPLRSQPGTASSPPILAMVARMAAPKDHLLLLRALERVQVHGQVLLIGGGPERPQVEAAIAARGLSSRVTLLGDRRDVPELLASSHVFALISRQEGFPLAILEAMRAGLPVIASDVGGVREAVEDGVTGALVARGDEAGLCEALTRLLGDPGLRARQGAAGRRRYEERFTVERMLDQTAAVYQEVVSLPTQREIPR